jgi:glutathionylspermidine synthase
MSKLKEKQRQEIIARYISGESKNSIAKSFNVSHTAISKILEDEKVSKSFNKFQDETTLDMLSFLESKKGQAQRLITIALDSVEDKLKKAYLKDTISAIEKLSTIFNTNKLNTEDENNGITVIIKDCSGEKESSKDEDD